MLWWYLLNNTYPQSSLSSSLGSGALRWLNLFVQDINAEQIDTYNLVASENVTADYFIGNGSQLTGISSVSLGADNQIPYTNSEGDDFDYSARFTFDGTDAKLKADNSKLYFGAADDYSIEWDGADAIHTITAGDFVFNGGDVGIGTDSPDYLLDVAEIGNSVGEL